MPPHFDDTEERKAGPPRHTAEQLAIIACPHAVDVPRRWWHEQAAAASDAAKNPMIPALQERLKRLAVPCTSCGALLMVRYSDRPTFARRIVLRDGEVGLGGQLEDTPIGVVVDERDLPPEPVGVIDEADLPPEVELPARSRRR